MTHLLEGCGQCVWTVLRARFLFVQMVCWFLLTCCGSPECTRSIWRGTHVYVSTKLLAFRSSWIFNLEGGCTLFVKTHVLSTPIGNPTRRTDNDQRVSTYPANDTMSSPRQKFGKWPKTTRQSWTCNLESCHADGYASFNCLELVRWFCFQFYDSWPWQSFFRWCFGLRFATILFFHGVSASHVFSIFYVYKSPPGP